MYLRESLTIASYNINHGGTANSEDPVGERITRIIKALRRGVDFPFNYGQQRPVRRGWQPNIIALQEASCPGDGLEKIAQELGKKHAAISSNGEKNFPVATLSEHPILESVSVEGMRNAALISVIQLPFAFTFDKEIEYLEYFPPSERIDKLILVNMHLTPVSVKNRLEELGKILETIKEFQQRYSYAGVCIVGDGNFLVIPNSPEIEEKIDRFLSWNRFNDPLYIYELADLQQKKFLNDDPYNNNALTEYNKEHDLLVAEGFSDIGHLFRNYTATTHGDPQTGDTIHQSKNPNKYVRVDYGWVNGLLLPFIKDYGVLSPYRENGVNKRKELNKASDHYPIYVVFSNLEYFTEEDRNMRAKEIKEGRRRFW